MAIQTISLRVICIDPPIENFGLQDKNKELKIGISLSDNQTYFDFQLKVKQTDTGTPNFTGNYAHGSVTERFVYLTTKNHEGTIIRRIKVQLKTIQWEQVQAVLDHPSAFLQVRVEGHGTGSVPLLGDGWEVRTE